jgi:hypothetical protein
MPRLEVPLKYRTLYANGDILLRAELRLLLNDNTGGWKAETFLVDSGTEMTTMPAALARQLALSVPQNAVRGAGHAQTGLEIRSGILRAQVVGLDGTEYTFPCLFLGDPQVPVPTGPPAAIPRKLLGLPGVIDKLRLLFDGTPAPGAPYGHLVVEKQ